MNRLLVPLVLLSLACAGLRGGGPKADPPPPKGDPPARVAPAPSAPSDPSGPGTPAGPGWVHAVHVTSGGLDRTAYVHVPANAKGKSPLVVMFHGGKGSQTGEDGRKMAAKWDQWADHGVVFAFPDGIGATDPPRAWAGPDDKRDITFVNDLIDQLVKDANVDPTKVYATGFSNGSGMVWMLECLDTDRFAGFGHVEQTMADVVLKVCKPSKHVPTIVFNGDADQKSPWDGADHLIGVPKTMDFVLGFHHCDPAKTDVTELPDLPADTTKVTRTIYTGCKDVAAVELNRIHGGAHNWPSTYPTRIDEPGQCRDVDAGDETIRFWRQYAGL